LQTTKMPLDQPPPRDNRFGSPLELARVHWVRPEMVVDVTYLSWTEDNLLRQVAYQGEREDKPAKQVVRSIPHPPRLVDRRAGGTSLRAEVTDRPISRRAARASMVRQPSGA
jgi:ATP-dependent DNA ligase